MANTKLDAKTIDEIKSRARNKIMEYSKCNDVIGGQIFDILELNSKVLYYPVEDEEVWGFSEKIKGKNFVWINTFIEYDKQVFAAAHELYHLWFDNEGEIILKSNMEEINDKISLTENELKANRFAAEFLIDKELLLQEIKTYGIDKDKIDIKEILRLSILFVVPYKTMVKRLYETDIIKNKKYNEFMTLTNEDVIIWRNRLGLSLPARENKIGLHNLIDMAMELYERKKITIEKLEYLLDLAGLTLEKMGIKEQEPYIPPTDEELGKSFMEVSRQTYGKV